MKRLVITSAVAILAGQAAAQVQVLAIPAHPQYGQLIPRRISGDGNVVVGYGTASGTTGLVWTISTNTIETLPSGSPAGARHTLSDCSYDGSVVVGTCNGPSGQTGLMWVRGGAVMLMTGQNGQPRMFSGNTISADGRVAGGDTPSGGNRAAIWTVAGGTQVLVGSAGTGNTRHVEGLSADGTTAVGVLTSTNPFAWRVDSGVFVVPTPPGLGSAYRLTLTGLGDAIYGMAGSSTPGMSVPFTWNPDTGTTVIPDMVDYGLTINGGNDDGRLIVGGGNAVDPNAPDAAIIHTFGAGTVTLAEYLSFFGASYAPGDFRVAMGISDSGNVIMGRGGMLPYWVVITPPLGRGDFNVDQFVDFHDLSDYLDCFEGLGPLPVSSADLNRDGITDFFDLIEFYDRFGG